MIVLANVLSIVKDSETNLFVLETSEGTYHAKAVIVSGGANPRHAGFTNEEKLPARVFLTALLVMACSIV